MTSKQMLQICLLGGFELLYGEQSIALSHSLRQQALLAYLVLHRAAPQSRLAVASALWPDSPERRAQSSLRNLLHQLRQSLPGADSFLVATSQTIQWRNDGPFVLDVDQFEQALNEAERTVDPAGVRAALERAVALYTGDLLPGCYDEWMTPRRQQLRQTYTSALERLVQLLAQTLDYPTAIQVAWRLQQVDPLSEDAYRHLMELYTLAGNRAEALRCYALCVEVLDEELGVEPDASTQELYARIRHAGLAQATALPAAPSGGIAVPLVGRRAEWAQMQALWQATSAGKAQVLLLSGEAGIGKTRLAEELVRWTERLGFGVAYARCYAAEGRLAYAPVVTWLQSDFLRTSWSRLDDIWLAEVARLLPELGVTRPDLLALQPPAEGWHRTRLFEALAHAFLIGGKPLLLVLDDLQWCDLESLEWMRYLLRLMPGAPLLIVATLRTGEVAAGDYVTAWMLELRRTVQLVELELDRLDARETAKLAEQIAGQSLDPGLLAALHASTEGNPLFVVESMHTTMAAADLHGDTAFRPPNMSPHIQAVIEARLAVLSPGARQVAGLAAVIGRAFGLAVLVDAAGGDHAAVTQAVDELW
jgi:DNA-binding SARP family transcriptional activator